MKAIAKYLPVEIPYEQEVYTTANPHPTGRPSYQQKLFAVTQDISKGDDMIWLGADCPANPYGLRDIAMVDNPIKGWFKVLGEISPKAIWVKEGDEINVRQGVQVNEYLKPSGDNTKIVFEVKCPTCNTFH